MKGVSGNLSDVAKLTERCKRWTHKATALVHKWASSNFFSYKYVKQIKRWLNNCDLEKDFIRRK